MNLYHSTSQKDFCSGCTDRGFFAGRKRGGWVDRFFHDLIIDYSGVVYLHV